MQRFSEERINSCIFGPTNLAFNIFQDSVKDSRILLVSEDLLLAQEGLEYLEIVLVDEGIEIVLTNFGNPVIDPCERRMTFCLLFEHEQSSSRRGRIISTYAVHGRIHSFISEIRDDHLFLEQITWPRDIFSLQTGYEEPGSCRFCLRAHNRLLSLVGLKYRASGYAALRRNIASLLLRDAEASLSTSVERAFYLQFQVLNQSPCRCLQLMGVNAASPTGHHVQMFFY